MTVPPKNVTVSGDDGTEFPLGETVTNWFPPPSPPRQAMVGRYCTVVPLSVDDHSADLFAAVSADREHLIWRYLPYGPFENFADYQTWLTENCCGDDPLFFTVIDNATGKAAGVASYLRINPAAGSVEVGHINYAPALQRTAAATEAMYLMMRTVFQLGYRRYEWKCNALNQKSRAAAVRLGFRYEGIFRQMLVVKGRNRDSAWYSVIDKEWSAIKRAMETWLAPENFGDDGVQIKSLRELNRVASPEK